MELTQQEKQFAKESIVKTGLFAGCTEQQMNQLLDGLEKQPYKANATILFQGEISSKLSIVQNGKVSINVRAGKEKIKVAELAAGSYFGEISLLRPTAATATVKAEGEADIIFLPGEIVQALVKSDPMLSSSINSKIEERLKANKPEEK